jgi:hypothetical protein
MKYIKMLGLAAIAAAALTAILGAGTASATTLCENSTTTGCAKHVNSNTTIKFTAEDSIKLLGPFSIIIDTCTASTVEGPTTSTGNDTGGAVTGTITTLTFGNCTRPTTVSSTGTFETPGGAKDVSYGTMSISNIAGSDNGTVTSSGATVTVHEVPNIIGNPPTCAYTTNNTDLGTLTGSTTAPTFDISATISTETSGCPSGTWSGHYSYTGSTPFIVSAS